MTSHKTGDSTLLAGKVCFLLAGLGLVATEAIDHRVLLQIPAWEQSLLHWLVNALLLLVLGAAVLLFLRYAKQMSSLNAQLQEQNQSLTKLESHVDQRLVDSAQTLNLTLASVITQAELALQRTGDIEDIKVFSQLIDETSHMEAIVNELIEIKQLDAGSLAIRESRQEANNASAGL